MYEPCFHILTKKILSPDISRIYIYEEGLINDLESYNLFKELISSIPPLYFAWVVMIDRANLTLYFNTSIIFHKGPMLIELCWYMYT